MKKSLLAMAVMGAFAASANAQTSIQVYGSFDAGVRTVDNAQTRASSPVAASEGRTGTGGTALDRRTTMGSTGTYNSNRLGFRGTEDLGGGLQARFNLETGFNSGTGSLNNTISQLFDRTASVGIGGGWGSIDFGRQYSVSFRTIGAYDPFNYKYTGIIPVASATAGNNQTGNQEFTAATATASAVPENFLGTLGGTRFNNNIQYNGAFGPVTVRAEYSLGEQIGNTGDGAAYGVGGTFATGPFSVGAAYTKKSANLSPTNARLYASQTGATPAQTTVLATPFFQDNNQWTVGGAYKIGPVRLAGGYINEKQDLEPGSPELESKNAWVGASYALTPAAELSAAFYQTKRDAGARDTEGRRDLFIVGATYALSKRTNFYAEADVSRLKGTARLFGPAGVVEDRVTGISAGINHLF